MAYVNATYSVPKSGTLEKKAASIAYGLTVGSWTELPATRQKEMQKHLGVVQAIQETEDRALITIGYPLMNLGSSFSSLLITVFGKLSMDQEIRLEDLELPEAWLKEYTGPRLGIEGIRQALGVYNRPLLMSIFKSAIGFSADEMAREFYKQAIGGADLIKDDEVLLTESPAAFVSRVRRMVAEVNNIYTEVGRKILYVAHLAGKTSTLVDQALRAIDVGAMAFLVSPYVHGLDTLAELRRALPEEIVLVSHPAFAGAIYQGDRVGVSTPLLLGKLLRIAGADMSLFPSPYGSVTLKRSESLAVGDALRQPIQGIKSAWPVPSAGIHPGLIKKLMEDFGLDVVVNAGGGIHGHPQGAIAGARAFQQAMDHLLTAAPVGPELEIALAKWGVS